MSFLFSALILISIIFLALNFFSNSNQIAINQGKNDLLFKKKYYFFSIPEKKFYNRLFEIINGKFIIFSKVRMMDLLEAPKFDPYYRKNQNKIKAKHVDFVICDKEKLVPLLAIELDGSSHRRNDRAERDRFVDEAFRSAGLPLIHILNSDIENKDKIYQELSKYLIPEDKQNNN